MKKPTKALEVLLARALDVNIAARLINNPRKATRTHSGSGSTFSPSGVIMLDGKSYSLGGARQYIAARERA